MSSTNRPSIVLIVNSHIGSSGLMNFTMGISTLKHLPAENSRIQRDGPDNTRRASVFPSIPYTTCNGPRSASRTRMSRGVARTSLCQRGVNRTTESISDRTFLYSSVYPLALSERCKSTACREGLHSAALELQLLTCPTTDWVYIQGYPVLKSKGRYVHEYRFPRSCFSVGLGPHAREHITGFRPSAAHAL